MANTVQPPKGTRDFLPEEMIVRRKVLEELRNAFNLYGYNEIDSPVFEYFELLSRKCGDEIEKEIYTFNDKAGRKLGLRFEFTSPLGRYYASNNAKLEKPFKRYAIGKVYRYENPQAGRYREFYQADADIVGSYSMSVELELLDMAVFILGELGFNNYEILINNRKILDGIIYLSGIPAEKKDSALRILDKMSKIGEDAVVKEFIENDLTDDNYKSFMTYAGMFHPKVDNITALNLLKEKLSDMPPQIFYEKALEGINELLFIFESANQLNFGHLLKFDPLLVRGLGYYTGPIFEIRSSDAGIGSFAAGGRYDNLIELYGTRPEGACGISFGVERIIDIINLRQSKSDKKTPSAAKVFVAYLSENERLYAFKTAKTFRSSGISCEININEKANLSKQLKYANNKGISFVVVIGESEVLTGKIKLKDMAKKEELLISIEEAIIKVKELPFIIDL
jgi:histidyl-tRNA synthetase